MNHCGRSTDRCPDGLPVNTIPMMALPDKKTESRESRLGQPGWVALLFVLAIAFLVIGGMLLGMMQAPMFPRKLVAFAWICVAVGVVLVAVAWLGRRR